MRPELARLYRIECHLLGLSPPVGAPAWEVQVLLDAELAADTATQRQLYASLRLAGRHQLRQELTAIHRRLYGPAPTSWWGVISARFRRLLRPGQQREG